MEIRTQIKLKITPAAARFALLFMGVGLSAAGLLSPAPAFARGAYSDAEMKSVEAGDEARIRELRGEEVKQLRITIGRRVPKNRLADLYFRLAEIHLEAYRAQFILEGRAHERRLERGEQDVTIDRSHSHPHLRAGIQACREILGFNIPYAKLDRVYYFLAFNYGELGNRKDSLKYYDYLTRNFPASAFTGEAYREMGDDAYDHAEFRKAQGFYEMAVKRAPEESRPRLYHKLAWSHYRIKDYERAVVTMKQAVESAGKSGEKFLSLREEALRDLAIFMTETGQVEEAIEYFRRVAGDETFYPRALERLGKQYERNVEPIKATRVYESMLRTHPGSEAAFRTRVKLVDLDLRRGLYPQALQRLNGMEIPKGGETETQVAAQNFKAMIRRTATEKHDAFRKKGNRADLTIAESFYTAYLASFLSKEDPRSETPEIHMYLAEVKRELGKSQEASDLYRRVVQSKDRRYAKEAGALWTASLAEAIKKSGTQSGGAKTADPSRLELEFVDAADRLQEALGDTPDGRDAAVRSAQVLAGYKNTQGNAITRSQNIIDAKPRSPQALTAARLWLQIESDRYNAASAAAASGGGGGDPSDAEDELRDAIKKLKANPELLAADSELGQGKLRTALSDEETRLKIKGIARKEKDRDFAEAAKGYEALAAGTTVRELSEKAYISSIRTWLKAGDTKGVDRVFGAWLKRFPPAANAKENKAIDIGREAATTYLVTGQFEFAIALFERLGTELKDPNSLETAARISEGTGDIPRTQQLLQRYISAYRESPQHGRLMLLSARLYDAAKQENEAAISYQACLAAAPDIAAECTARLADLRLRQGDLNQAKILYRKLAGSEPTPVAKAVVKNPKAGKSKPAAASTDSVFSPFVAYARYRLAELQEKEARFDPMQLPEAVLKKGLNQRVQFLETLNRAYSFAADAGGPWGIAALERFSAWASNFADEIEHIEAPVQANEENKGKFRAQLRQLSEPIRTKASSNRKEVYARALAAEILSPALPELVDRLSDLGPGRGGPGRAQGPRGRFRLSGIPADGGSEGRKAALEQTREKLLKSAQDAQAWLDYGNLLWGESKPLLARVAYERALALFPAGHGDAALNNRAVVLITSAGEEDWLASFEASQAFSQAYAQNPNSAVARSNRALLLNYYRLFAKARPHWEQVILRAGPSEAAEFQDGLGVSLQGTGDMMGAEIAFNRATEVGASKSRFTLLYHRAGRLSVTGPEGAGKCLDALGDIDQDKVAGFEKSAYEHLKRICTRWKGGK